MLFTTFLVRNRAYIIDIDFIFLFIYFILICLILKSLKENYFNIFWGFFFSEAQSLRIIIIYLKGTINGYILLLLYVNFSSLNKNVKKTFTFLDLKKSFFLLICFHTQNNNANNSVKVTNQFYSIFLLKR